MRRSFGEGLTHSRMELIGIMLAHRRDLKGACHDDLTAVDDRADEILAAIERWTDPVRSLPPLLQTSRRATRALLCPSAAARPDRADHVWAIEWVLHRSN